LIIANNVLAHVPNVLEFAEAVSLILAPDGLFVFEVAHLLDWQSTMSWDTVYHEHMSYHSVTPLVKMFASLGLQITDVERQPGQVGRGSLRVCVRRKGTQKPMRTVSEITAQEAEAGLTGNRFYRDLSASIERQKQVLTAHLDVFQRQKLKIIGYGAPAKLTTLMYTLGLGADSCEFIVEDNPRKIGLYTPGLKIPVVEAVNMIERQPDVCVIFAWNFAGSIMDKCRTFAAESGMRFAIPMPTYQEIQVGRGGV
jgi:hypothetical protein